MDQALCSRLRKFSEPSRRLLARRISSPARRRVMGILFKEIETMEDLFLHQLEDLYYAENQIIKSLPKMIDLATNRDLFTGLRLHLEETEKQVERLNKVFEKLGKEPRVTDCPAIDGLIKEANATAGDIADKNVLD